MIRRTPRPEPAREIELAAQTRVCPACGGPLWAAYKNRRTVVTLDGVVRLAVRVRRCRDPECPSYGVAIRPAAEGRLALPQHEFGLDVIALVGRLRHAEHGGDGGRDPERDGWGEYADALGRAQRAQRRVLMELRAEGVIGDDAFHRIEEELDWAEVNTAPAGDDEEPQSDSAAPPGGRDGRARSEGTSA